MKKQILSVFLAAVMLVSAVLATGAAAAVETGYDDVAGDRWSAEDIVYVSQKGMMQGVSETEFAPISPVTRAMVVTVLYRLAGQPEVKESSKFTDVPEGEWYAAPVAWGADNGIVMGFEDSTFAPMDPVSREQLVTFIGRYAELSYVKLGTAELDGYTDAGDVQSYAANYVKWAVGAGLIKGITEDKLMPGEGASREQFAAIMHRFDTAEFEYELVYNTPTAYSNYTEKDYPLQDDADFFVSTAGSDTNNGKTKESAFRTFERAKAAVNEAKATATDEIKVAFLAGDYGNLSLNFTAEDSGTEEAPIVYCAYGDGEVKFNNGLEIKGSEFVDITDSEKELFRASIASNIKKYDLNGKLTLEELGRAALFSDTELCTVARYPNKDNGVDVFSDGRAWTKVGARELKLQGLYKNRAKSYHTFDGVLMVGYLEADYFCPRVPIEKYDEETEVITLGGANLFTELAEDDVWFINTRGFFFENVTEELDHDGEYFIDKDTMTLYVYNPTGDYGFAVGGTFLNVAGGSHITFRGFDFSCNIGTAINFSHPSTDVHLDLCKVSKNEANNAMWMGGYDMSVTNSEFFILGGGGIYENCGTGEHKELLTSCKHVIENNSFHDTAIVNKTYHAPVQIGGCCTLVSHNEFYNTPHMAIKFSGVKEIVEYNVFTNCNREIDDAGTIYGGRSYTEFGKVIRYNAFINTSTESHQIYLDDGLSNVSVYGNLFYGRCNMNIQMSGGRNIDIYDNVMIRPEDNLGGETLINGWAKYYDKVFYEDEGWIGDWRELEAANYGFRLPAEGTPAYDAWMAEEPWIFELNYDLKKENLDDPNLIVNPTNDNIYDNYGFANAENCDFDIADQVKNLGSVYNNVVFSHAENPLFVDPTNGDYSIRGDVDLEAIDKIPFIPFAKMGRY